MTDQPTTQPTTQPTQNDTNETENGLSRRRFLTLAWGAAGAVVLGESGLLAYKFFAPKSAQGEFGGVFNLGAADAYPPKSVTPFTDGRFYLVRLEDGGFLALYRKCTHLGCAVQWDQANGVFMCPCHASAFEQEGTVLNPPAPRPLDRFTVTIENGEVLVDTGSPIQRDHASPDEIVYAGEAS